METKNATKSDTGFSGFLGRDYEREYRGFGSRFFIADLLTVLKQRGHAVSMTSLGTLEALMHVDGHSVTIVHQEGGFVAMSALKCLAFDGFLRQSDGYDTPCASQFASIIEMAITTEALPTQRQQPEPEPEPAA